MNEYIIVKTLCDDKKIVEKINNNIDKTKSDIQYYSEKIAIYQK